MEFKQYEPHTVQGDTWMVETVNGDYVPYQQAQAVLEQLNSVNAALEKHFGPASIAEVSEYVELYRKRIENLEAAIKLKDALINNT
jgi:hypothetical protein